MTKAFQTVVALTLVGGAAALSAQGVQLAGSDPVTIARSGTGVAFGRSLEAAGQNPALLVTLQEATEAHVALGYEFQASSTTAESNQRQFFTSDRNRPLPGFGFAHRLNPRLSWGLKLDQPFGRHLELRDGAPSRFTGDALSLSAHRLEGQLAWSPEGRPEWSFGIGLGVTRLGLKLGNRVRLGLPIDPTQPASVGNPVVGLAEIGLQEEGQAFTPSLTLGGRWALSSRWTLAATLESPLKGKPSLSSGYRASSLSVWDSNGYGSAPVGTDARAYQVVGTSLVHSGTGDVALPARFTVGMRHRKSQLFTWEVDLQWMGAGLRVPTFASINTLSGTTTAPRTLSSTRASLTAKAMGEFTLDRRWSLRMSLGMESGYAVPENFEPLLGGGMQSFYGLGAGYKVMGGELSFGLQYRIDKDQDRVGLQGEWDANGYRPTTTKVRTEGAGHLLSIGFRKSF